MEQEETRFPELLTGIPAELQWDIILRLPAISILNLCQINKQFANLCDNEALWKALTKRDFGKYGEEGKAPIFPTRTWKDTYLGYSAEAIFTISVSFKEPNVPGFIYGGELWISYKYPLVEIIKAIKELLGKDKNKANFFYFVFEGVELSSLHEYDPQKHYFLSDFGPRARIIAIYATSDPMMRIYFNISGVEMRYLDIFEETTFSEIVQKALTENPNVSVILTTPTHGIPMTSPALSNRKFLEVLRLYGVNYYSGIVLRIV